MPNQNQNMSNHKPTHILSGSQLAAVNIATTNVVTAIRTVAGNIINQMSGSGYIYAPYVTLQITSMPFGTTKYLPSIDLHCNNGKQKIYQFAIGKSYEFLFNYAKGIKNVEATDATLKTDEELMIALEKSIFKFVPRMKFFITNITETRYIFPEYNGNVNDIYDISVICDEKELIFCGTEIIDMLDKQIIRELP